MKSDEICAYIIKNNITVATCESCTGGLLAASFTDISGISSVFLEGVVTYSNEAKMRLGVKKETLLKFGAVSEETAKEMAQCVRARAGSDIGISTTGIAGPGGGTAQKPVGLVYAAIALADKTYVYKLNLCGDRRAVREGTVNEVYKHMKEVIENEYKALG